LCAGQTGILDVENLFALRPLPRGASVFSFRKSGRTSSLVAAKVLEASEDEVQISWSDSPDSRETRSWAQIFVERGFVEGLHKVEDENWEDGADDIMIMKQEVLSPPSKQSDQLLAEYAFVLTLPTEVPRRNCDRCEPSGNLSAPNKQDMARQILHHGGKVFESFSDCFKGRERLTNRTVILLANRPLRTVKYLMALALGVPTVSTVWLRTCCEKGIFIDPSLYRLANGFVKELGAFVSPSAQLTGVFGGFRAYVHSMSATWRSTWEVVLISAGATILPGNASNGPKTCDMIVADRPISAVTIKSMFNTRSVYPSVVSSEFVLQCVIAQRPLDPQSHHLYKPRSAVG
ncbi:BRCT domain-containing protein, partial [Gonapodya prolifera JEL478]